MQREHLRADEHPDAHGEIVWSWRPGAGVQRNALARCRDTGAIKPVPEESAYKPSNIAQGMPDDPATPVVTAACFSSAGGPWVRPSPGIPCALSFDKRVILINSSDAKCVARMLLHILLSCPRRRASSTPRPLGGSGLALEYWITRFRR